MPAPTATIRVCTPGDAAALSLIGSACFLEAFAGVLPAADILAHCARTHAPGIYRAWLQRDDSCIWSAEAQPGAAPVGYLVLAPPDLPLDIRSGDGEIKRVYLLHRFQGLGLGRHLMDIARQWARARGLRRLLLGVYSRNDAALGFYAHLGYRRIGQRLFRVGGHEYLDDVLALELPPD